MLTLKIVVIMTRKSCCHSHTTYCHDDHCCYSFTLTMTMAMTIPMSSHDYHNVMAMTSDYGYDYIDD